MNTCNPGFSLIEVLIALAIASIIGVALFTSITQMSRMSGRLDVIMHDDDRMAVIQHQLKKDLSGAFVPTQAVEQPADKDKKNKKPLQKVFYSSLQEKNLNILTFITTNPLMSYGNARPRVARVVYKLVAEKEKGTAPFYTLYRQQGNDLDFEAYKQENAKNRAYPVAEHIKSLSVEFSTPKKSPEKSASEPNDQATAKKSGAPAKKENVEWEIVKEWDSDKFDTPEKKEVPKKDTKSDTKNGDQQQQQKSQEKEKKERKWLPAFAKISITLWDENKKHEYSSQLIVPIVGASFTQTIQEPVKESSKKKEAQQKKEAAQPAQTAPEKKSGQKVAVAIVPQSAKPKSVFDTMFGKPAQPQQTVGVQV